MVIVSSVVWYSAGSRSELHLEAGHVYERQGDERRALRHYQWSARAYTPLSSTGSKALEKMWSLAQRREKTHPQLSLEAYDLMRGAIWSTRWLMTPYQNWAQRVDERITALRHHPYDREALARTLRVDPRPSIIQSLLVLLFSVGVILSVIRFTRVGLSSELQFTHRAFQYACLVLLMISGLFFSLAF